MVAVITGASMGIGKSLAQALCKQGYTVYSFSRSAPNGEQARHIFCDVASEQSVKDAFKEFFSKETQIDLFVNNAGIGISGAIENVKAEDLKRIFDVNFTGAVFCSQIAAKYMRERGAGKIVFVSSVASIFTIPFQSFYSASKMALNALSEGLRMELMPYGVKVGTLLLGDIDTGFTKNNRKEIVGEEPYTKNILNCLDVMQRDEGKGMKPDKVASKIAKYLKRGKLKPCKVFGSGFYKFVCVLNKILPRSLALKIVYDIYGKAK